jgi:hypothetical protein
VMAKTHGDRSIINLALNVTASEKRLAWQERKAAPFVVTPLYSGSAVVGLYEHPACQAPRRPSSSFLSFFLVPFSSSTAPQAFPRPDRRMLPPARAGCVKAGRFSAATVRPRPLHDRARRQA